MQEDLDVYAMDALICLLVILTLIIFFAAPDEVRDALSSIPWLLESISTVYGHREGFLKLMSQFMTITDQPEH